MVNHGTRFILSGSSPRKILHAGANLLGGRALRYELCPLIYREIPDFNLVRALNHGLLPRHFKGLTRFAEEYQVDQLILVSNDPSPRRIGDICVLPWHRFLDKLWAGEIIK